MYRLFSEAELSKQKLYSNEDLFPSHADCILPDSQEGKTHSLEYKALPESRT